MENEINEAKTALEAQGKNVRIEQPPLDIYAEKPPVLSKEGIIAGEQPPQEEVQKTRQKQRELNFEELSSLAKTWMQGYAQNMDPNSKAAMNVVAMPMYVAEELNNFGVDVVNAASNLVGGKDILESTNMVERYLPDDPISNFSREGAKLLLGYAGSLQTVKNTVGIAEKVPRATSAAAGYLSELIMSDPNNDTMIQQFLRKIPATEEVADYMTMEDDDDGNLEKRMKNSLYGLLEGEIAEGVFFVLKHAKNVKSVNKAIQKVQEFMVDESGSVGGGGPKDPTDGPPPVPEKRNDLPPSIPELPADLKKNAKPIGAEKTPVNEEMVDDIMFLKDLGNVNVSELPEGRVMNLTAFDTEDDIRSFIDAIIQRNPKYFNNVKVDDAMLQDIAMKRNMTPEDLLKWEEDFGLKRGTIIASEMVMLKAAQSWLARAKAYKAGNATRKELASELSTLRSMVRKVFDMRSLSGSLLRESGVAASMGNTADKVDFLNYIFSQDMDMVVDAALASNTTSNMFLEALQDGSTDIASSINRIRMSSMLSNPATHLRNIYGGLTQTAGRVAETYMAATYNSLPWAYGNGIKFADAHSEAFALWDAILDTPSIVKKAIDLENPPMGIRPSKSKLPSYMRRSESKPASKLGQFLYYMGDNPAIGRALLMGDNYVKHMNARMTLHREAHRRGREFIKNNQNATDEQYMNEVYAEMIDPSFATKIKMYNDAEYVTLTNDVEGPILRSFEAMAQNPVGRFIMPFSRVNLNAISYKMERIPIVNMALRKARQDMFGRASTPETRQLALAKMTTTPLMMGALTYVLHGRDALQGSSPTNPQKRKMFRDMGMVEGSIKVGNNYVEIRKETPMGAILNLSANLAHLYDAIPEDQAYVYNDIATGVAASIAEIVEPEFFTDSVAQLVDAIRSDDANMVRNIVGYTGRQATTFMPYSSFAREINRQFFPEADTKDPSSLINQIWGDITKIYAPWLNSTKRDILGYPLQHKVGMGAGLISPLGIFRDHKSPVMKELRRLSDATKFEGEISPSMDIEGVGNVTARPPSMMFTMPDRTITRVDPRTGGSQIVKLDPDQYETFVLEMANLKYEDTDNGPVVNYSSKVGNDGSPTLEQRLRTTIDSSDYKSLPDMLKYKRLRSIINASKERAKANLNRKIRMKVREAMKELS